MPTGEDSKLSEPSSNAAAIDNSCSVDPTRISRLRRLAGDEFDTKAPKRGYNDRSIEEVIFELAACFRQKKARVTGGAVEV